MKTFKIVVAILASAYFLWCAANPAQWHFIDNVNLFVHEGGHVVFSFFGWFMYVLGGSLMQVLLPTLFVIYFYRQQQYYSAALTLFWVGENLLNVSVYAGDAIKMQLSLLFGDNSIHDWNWLLVYTGQLRHTAGIAMTIQVAGTLTIIIASIWSVWTAVKPPKPVEGLF